MGDPSRYRDSTQIVLPAGALDGLDAPLDERFTVTLFERDGVVRIIGSPVEIRAASDYLARQGISLP
ncbi:VNG_1110C family protein [Halarchaeum nitratireducens]|uniref:Uncharacterized protein n=1 Tax=Halarchaeum nitratireducens TaxID=489913 RepID=A0A830GET5_9EURY|nr:MULTISPECIES: hypothetical protein [Halarchaeum]MBP2251748.1 hypothetical protein [Halarchaeum solikamskense]GGN22578.1 hypothetical protein GCM10009021_25140 [Halarchaeum nitratireducens]